MKVLFCRMQLKVSFVVVVVVVVIVVVVVAVVVVVVIIIIIIFLYTINFICSSIKFLLSIHPYTHKHTKIQSNCKERKDKRRPIRGKRRSSRDMHASRSPVGTTLHRHLQHSKHLQCI